MCDCEYNKTLLSKLLKASQRIDAEYCTIINETPIIKGYSLSVEEYEKFMDIFIEVENYLNGTIQ